MLSLPLAPLWAQSSAPVLEMGPDFEYVGLDQLQVIGSDGTHYYASVRVPRDRGTKLMLSAYTGDVEMRLRILKFNQDMEMVLFKDLDPFTGEDEEKVRGIILSQERLFLLSIHDDLANRQLRINQRELDTETFDFLQAAGTTLFSVDYKGHPEVQRKLELNLSVSRDSSKILISYPYPTARQAEQVYGAALLDSDMNSLWHHYFTLPYQSRELATEAFRVNNEGKAFLLAKYTPKGANRPNNPNAADFTFKIFALMPGADKPDEHDVIYGEWYLESVNLEINRQGNLICTGSYADRYRNPKGIFFLTLDQQTMTVLTESQLKLEPEILKGSSINISNLLDNPEKAFRGFVFDEVVLRTDGGAIIIGEYERPSTTTTYANDVLIINVNPDGQIANTHHIRKVQYDGNPDRIISYVLAVSETHLHLIYHDLARNVELPPNRLPGTFVPVSFTQETPATQVLLAYTLESGVFPRRTVLSSLDKIGKYAGLNTAAQIGTHEIVMIFTQGRQNAMGRIRFE